MTGLADLEIRDEIGRGGFAVVHRAWQPRFAREVAVKTLSASLDNAGLTRFERECRAAGSLSWHPHIVTIFDGGISDAGAPYLVMELLSGGSFGARVRRSGPVAVEETVATGVAIASALGAAHDVGLVHRDVKPDNILTSASGTPALADFGIAWMGEASLTRTGMVVASLAHAAPEVLEGERATPRSDVYSLASTLVTLLLGRPPFVEHDDDTPLSVITRIEAGRVPDLRPHGIPDALCAVLEQGLAKDPKARPKDGNAFERALRAACPEVSEAVPSVPASAPENSPASTAERAFQLHIAPTANARRVAARRAPGRAWIVAGAAAAVLGLVAGGLVIGKGDGGETDETELAATNVVSHRFAAEATPGGLTINRSWRWEDGTLGSVTTVQNATDAPITDVVDEVIPEAVAASLDDVAFDPRPNEIQGERVAQWSVSVRPGESLRLRYEVRVPGADEGEEQLLAWAEDADAARMAHRTSTGSTATLVDLRLPDSVSVVQGQSVVLDLVGNLSDGSPADASMLVSASWTSEGPTIATVARGVVTGVAAGSTKVVAIVRGVRRAIRVDVVGAASPVATAGSLAPPPTNGSTTPTTASSGRPPAVTPTTTRRPATTVTTSPPRAPRVVDGGPLTVARTSGRAGFYTEFSSNQVCTASPGKRVALIIREGDRRYGLAGPGATVSVGGQFSTGEASRGTSVQHAECREGTGFDFDNWPVVKRFDPVTLHITGAGPTVQSPRTVERGSNLTVTASAIGEPVLSCNAQAQLAATPIRYVNQSCNARASGSWTVSFAIPRDLPTGLPFSSGYSLNIIAGQGWGYTLWGQFDAV